MTRSEGKKRYNEQIANDPVIPCNQFPSWEEFSIEIQNNFIEHCELLEKLKRKQND